MSALSLSQLDMILFLRDMKRGDFRRLNHINERIYYKSVESELAVGKSAEEDEDTTYGVKTKEENVVQSVAFDG